MIRSLPVAGLMAFVLFLGATMACSEALAGTASIRFNLYKAGFIVGVSGGKGTVTFQGKRYPISIGGVSSWRDNWRLESRVDRHRPERPRHSRYRRYLHCCSGWSSGRRWRQGGAASEFQRRHSQGARAADWL